MIKKRYIVLSILGILLYGFFFYEPELNDSDAKKYMAIEVSGSNVDIDIPNAVNIQVNEDQDNTRSSINVADAVKIKSSKDEAGVNLLGIGSDIEAVEHSQTDDLQKSEVSIRSDNPMVFRAGNTIDDGNTVFVDGMGIGEIYEFNGQNLNVGGIKNHLKIEGDCGKVMVNGMAMIIRAENATLIDINGMGNAVYIENADDIKSVYINGMGNRLYVDDQLVTEEILKNGFLNFVFKD